MTIPTFENLPQVAPVAPEVRPQQQLDRFQRQQMGAPGEALEGMGKAVEGAGMDATRISDAMAQQQNEDTAKAAATQHQQYVNNLLFTSADGQGGPGLFALKGQAAVDAAPSVLAAITAQRDQATNGMTQQAKNAYVNQTNTQIAAATETVQRHTMLQAADAATSTSQARIQTATDTGTLNYNDPATLAASAQTIHSEAADQARRQGWLPNADGTPSVQQTIYEKAQLSKMYAGAIDNAHAKGDILGAASLLQNYGSQMDGAANVRAQEMLKPGLLKIHATQANDVQMGGQASSGSGGSMDQPYQQGAGYYDAVHGGEGNGVNPKSGASGPVQVIGKTADDFHASPEGQGVDVNTEAGARQFTKWYGDQNAQKISAVTGQPATMGQVVSAHLLGPGGATSILSRPSEPIGNFLSSDAIKNNPGPLPGGPSMTGAEAQKSIADYYAKASGNQFAGPGVPTAASVAAQKPPRPDFEGMVAAIPRDPKDPDLYDARVSDMEHRKNVYDMGETIQRKKLDETTIPQTLQAMENGAVDTMVPELAIRQSHNEAESDQIMSKFADARQFGTLLNANKYASPDDINKQLTDLHAQVASASAGTDVAATSQAVKGEAMLTAVLAKRQEQLKADSWSYVRQEPSVAAAYSGDMNNPANVAAAIARSMAVQTHLGAEPQSIATASINKNVSDIHAAAPSAVPGMMDNLKGQYGSAWPTVFHDLVAKGKLDPDYQTLATMPTGSPGRVDFAAALTAKADKGDKFGAAAAENTVGAKSAIEQRMKTDLDPFQNSFQGSSGDGAIEGYRNSVRTLATFYADRGMDPTQAAKTAYAQVLGNTDVSGFIRAPKTLNGQPFSAQKVLDAGQSVTDHLRDGDLQDVTAAQAKQGSWATNPDGMGATLLVQNASGSWRMVRGREDGRPVQIDYRTLPAVTASPQTPNALGISGTAQVQ